MRCKSPFWICLWSSCSQFPCFWIIPMALRRFEMACWVTLNNSANSSCVWHESSESLQIFDLSILTSTYNCSNLSKNGGSKVVHLIYDIIGGFEGRNCKKDPEWRKSVLSRRQCTVSQIDCSDGKIAWIALWISSPSTVFSGSGS